MNAAVKGGFRIVEFTLSIPDALELIEEFSAQSDLIVGAGTVGFVNSLFDSKDIADENWSAIERRAAQMLQAVHNA